MDRDLAHDTARWFCAIYVSRRWVFARF